jgi:hypothetical protein
MREHSLGRYELRILIVALTREHDPAVEAGGVVAQMPLPDEAGVIPAASRSRCGVWFTTEPYVEIAWWAWSSKKIKRMLGRAPGAAVASAPTKAESPIDTSPREIQRRMQVSTPSDHVPRRPIYLRA